MDEKPLTFRAKLFRPAIAGSTTFLRAPAKIMKVFNTKARVPVRGTINGTPFRSSLSPMGGSHLMPVNAALRAAAKVKAGDTVKVVLTRDTAPRVVKVPNDFAARLKRSGDAAEFFNGLSYSHQTEYVAWINDAKREETRSRRIEAAIARLSKRIRGT
jgi:hypothetical protein